MLALFERKSINVKDLGEILYLDSGTLTPLLKKLESKGYVTRKRSSDDERMVIVHITDAGMKLRDLALSIPEELKGCVELSLDEIKSLFEILHKIMPNLQING